MKHVLFELFAWLIGGRKLGLLIEEEQDPRDWVAEEVLGANPGDNDIKLPDYVNHFEKADMYAKSQGLTNHCTSYALAGCMECLNRLEHDNTWIIFNPEELWDEQLKSGATEKKGDFLRNCLDSLRRLGGLLYDGVRYAMFGYTFVKNRTPKDLQKWLARGHVVFTGVVTNMWGSAKNSDFLTITKRGGGHAIWICGYKYIKGELYFIAINSWGAWGKNSDGMFYISAEQVLKTFTWYIPFDAKDDLRQK